MSGRYADAERHARSSVKKEDRRRGRRRCPYPVPGGGHCPNPSTHYGMANGLALTEGCEWHVRRWVNDWRNA